MLCGIMPNAAMLILIADSRLAFKIMPVANTLDYSVTTKYGHYALCINAWCCYVESHAGEKTL